MVQVCFPDWPGLFREGGFDGVEAGSFQKGFSDGGGRAEAFLAAVGGREVFFVVGGALAEDCEGTYFALGEGQGFAVFNSEDVVREGPVLGVGFVA